MRRFFVPGRHEPGQIVEITGSEARHAIRVLRLGPGDDVEILDGVGNRSVARIEKAEADRVTALVTETLLAPPPALSVTLALAFLKSDKMDFVVNSATQLGISAFVPFEAKRSVARPNAEKTDSRIKRWERIAREAVKQCGLSVTPRIERPVDLEALCSMGRDFDFALAFWEEDKTPLSAVAPQNPPKSVLVVIGPEGGLNESEIESMKDAGFKSASLGPRIMRAETAAVSALVLVQYLFGDLRGRS